MKKIPTLFERVFENHKIIGITDKITPGCEEAFYNGIATVKIDGSCCAIINGTFYKRYDAKNGNKPPEGAIPCCKPDSITGHHPHWVKVDPNYPEDRWFYYAFRQTSMMFPMDDGTYEAIGKHFNGNPYHLDSDVLVRHGTVEVRVERTFEGVKEWLLNNYQEGLVFWLYGIPVCKIKRSDFGLPWGRRN